MNSSDPNELFHQLTTVLDNFHPDDWGDIVSILNQIRNQKKTSFKYYLCIGSIYVLSLMFFVLVYI